MTSPTTATSSPRTRKDIRNAAIVSLAAIAVIVAAYMFWPQRPGRVWAPHERTITYVMISDLRALVTQEAVYRQLKGQYTSNPDNTYFMRSPGVSRPEITVKGSGWFATVSHVELPGVTCAIAVGVRNPLDRRAPETEAVCR